MDLIRIAVLAAMYGIVSIIFIGVAVELVIDIIKDIIESLKGE